MALLLEQIVLCFEDMEKVPFSNPLLNNKIFDWIKLQSLAHPSTECSVSYCDHSPPVGVRPTV